MTKLAYIVIYLRTILIKTFCTIFLRPFGAQSDSVDLRAARQILVIRPDEIGDFVLSTPFLAELRRYAPNAKITVVVKPDVISTAALCPAVDIVFGYDHRWLSTSFWFRPVTIPLKALVLAVRSLRKSRFDAVFLPRRAADQCYATYLAYFSGARNRIGFSERATSDKAVYNHGFDMLLTHVCVKTSFEHAADSPLELLRLIGLEPQTQNPKLVVSQVDSDNASGLLMSLDVSTAECIIALGPSPGHSILKQWPADRFVALGKTLVDELGCKIVIVGALDEVELADGIANSIGPLAKSLAGKTDIPTLAAVLAKCRLYIGNDIGPSHISAAVGTKTVALFGASCSHIYAPRGDVRLIVKELNCGVCKNGHKLDRCAACIYETPKCMDDITVNEVLQTCRSILMLA